MKTILLPDMGIGRNYEAVYRIHYGKIRPAGGYGSRTIETPKAEYPGKRQVVDLEMPDSRAEK